MAPPLSDAEIEERLASAGEWHRAGAQVGGPPAIERDLKFENFAAAIDFVNRVAALAEEANHHPDIFVHGWNKVRLRLSTHSQAGLTDADFRLAAQIEGLL